MANTTMVDADGADRRAGHNGNHCPSATIIVINEGGYADPPLRVDLIVDINEADTPIRPYALTALSIS